LKVKFECSKVRFEWLKCQRSVQHAEDIRVNECTPRECTSACKAREFYESKARVFESQVRVVEGAEEGSTSRRYPSQRMHSKAMYLRLQGTRILVGFWRVSAASSGRSEHARGWSHGIFHTVESLGRRGYCVCSGLVH